MTQVYLTWTPSVSPGVESQKVRIFNTDSLEVYGEAELGPNESQFGAPCPEGVTVQGAIVTIRGNEEVPLLSNTVIVPYKPLQGATDAVLEIPV